MALNPEEPGKRECLRCNKVFSSRNAGNRICPRCTPKNEHERADRVAPAVIYVGDQGYQVGPDE